MKSVQVPEVSFQAVAARSQRDGIGQIGGEREPSADRTRGMIGGLLLVLLEDRHAALAPLMQQGRHCFRRLLMGPHGKFQPALWGAHGFSPSFAAANVLEFSNS